MQYSKLHDLLQYNTAITLQKKANIMIRDIETTASKVIRVWMNDEIKGRAITCNAWAARAGVSPTTLTRFLNDENSNHVPSSKTLFALCREVGSMPNFAGVTNPPGEDGSEGHKADDAASKQGGSNSVGRDTYQNVSLDSISGLVAIIQHIAKKLEDIDRRLSGEDDSDLK